MLNVSRLTLHFSNFINLSLRADVFASLCVLVIFDTMDKDKRSLLDDQIDISKTRDCYRVGMELLRAADQSSKLIGRLIAVLERLRGDSTGEEWSSLRGKSVDETYLPPDTGTVENARNYPKFQTNMYPWATNALGPMFNNYIDFSDLDTFFPDFGNY